MDARNHGIFVRRSFLAALALACALGAALPVAGRLPQAPAQPAPPAPASAPAKSGANPEAGSSAPAKREQLPGLPQFGRVNETLYRGAQPKDAGFAELKKMGVDVVVNLRGERTEIERERKLVEAQGMKYVSLPWSSWHTPKDAQVAQFLLLLRQHPQPRVFVHCERGAERTGLAVAAYRIAFQQWTPQQALAEMKEFRFRENLYSHFKKYVREFPQQLESDASLKQATGRAP